jgi:ribosome-associated translation inhibitor RaiA
MHTKQHARTHAHLQVKTIREQIVDIETLIADVEIKHSDLLVADSAEGTKTANAALDAAMEKISMVANRVRTSLKRMAEQNKAEEVRD